MKKVESADFKKKEMSCGVCRKYPAVADRESRLFLGIDIFSLLQRRVARLLQDKQLLQTQMKENKRTDWPADKGRTISTLTSTVSIMHEFILLLLLSSSRCLNDAYSEFWQIVSCFSGFQGKSKLDRPCRSSRDSMKKCVCWFGWICLACIRTHEVFMSCSVMFVSLTFSPSNFVY